MTTKVCFGFVHGLIYLFFLDMNRVWDIHTAAVDSSNTIHDSSLSNPMCNACSMVSMMR